MTEQVQVEVPSKRRLDLLDYLRFAAAAMVVCYHYLFYGTSADIIDVSFTPLAPIAKYGYLGVDLFFLISGFVIMESARGKTARQFAVSRVTRLYPAFWTAIAITASAIVLFGERVGLSSSIGQVAVNLTMAPNLAGVAPVDGVYWSLLYELEFYALIFLLLLLRQGRRIGAFLPWWPIGMLVLSLVAPSLASHVFLGGYFGYFAIGALITEIRHGGPTLLRTLGVLAGSIVVLRWAGSISGTVASQRDVEVSGVVVGSIVLVWILLIASMTFPRVAGLKLPHAILAGAVTYPLYLLHANLGYIFMSFWITDDNRWLVYPATIGLMLLLAAGVHYVVEKRKFWRRVFNATVGAAVGLIERPEVRSETGRTVAAGSAGH